MKVIIETVNTSQCATGHGLRAILDSATGRVQTVLIDDCDLVIQSTNGAGIGLGQAQANSAGAIGSVILTRCRGTLGSAILRR
jgi:hypothetical protein